MSTPSSEVLVGITGHREIADVSDVIARLNTAVDAVEAAYPDHKLHLLTPLAEGADRCAARVFLQRARARISAILPADEEAYRQDFGSLESRAEFRELLSHAATVINLEPFVEFDQRYRRAGDYILDHCRVLLAVWDGRPSRGPGGTAEIVGLARERSLPLIFIPVGPDAAALPAIVYERFPPARSVRAEDRTF